MTVSKYDRTWFNTNRKDAFYRTEKNIGFMYVEFSFFVPPVSEKPSQMQSYVCQLDG